MKNAENHQTYLSKITLVTASHRYQLSDAQLKVSSALKESVEKRKRTLAGEAMRWTYVLRSRERWKREERALGLHELSAIETLSAFGLGDKELKEIALSNFVTVEMPYIQEAIGWAGRIFPWEFVIASATRRFRIDGRRLTVVRNLNVPKFTVSPVPKLKPRILFIQCEPSILSSTYHFDDEIKLIQRSFARSGQLLPSQFKILKSPSLFELRGTVIDFRPEIIHFAGYDNHEGMRLIKENGGTKSTIWCGTSTGDKSMSVGEFFQLGEYAIDGLLLRGEHGFPRITSAQEIGEAIVFENYTPYLVSLNVGNSAARTAPLLLSCGVLAAVGFQDAFDDALAEYFFEVLYSKLRVDWNLPEAFDQAWAALRSQPDLGQGNGIVLWARAPLIDQRPAQQSTSLVFKNGRRFREGDLSVECRIKPKKELNYSALHNHGALFDEFELRNNQHPSKTIVEILVELHCGSEQARYTSSLEIIGPRLSLTDIIRVPLTATLMRSVSEAVQSSLFVEVRAQGNIVIKDTYPLRLLPVDQWLDNDRSGQWLPSFVLPRDPAVESIITMAQRYVRIIRDDPTAGFEGYQSVSLDQPESMDQVDLQVEAIWAVLLHDWQLGYINPPPTYVDTSEGVYPLDSQRLRTPSNIRRVSMGTCIDLSLLFAACLELVDIYPVIFLLNGHALPGYWRHHDFQAEYRDVLDPDGSETENSENGQQNEIPGAQKIPWKVGKSGFRELRKQIRAGRLVPIETVRLTENSSFREAMKAGTQALSDEVDFDSVLDIITARRPHNVTPLPIIGDQRP